MEEFNLSSCRKIGSSEALRMDVGKGKSKRLRFCEIDEGNRGWIETWRESSWWKDGGDELRKTFEAVNFWYNKLLLIKLAIFYE